MRAVCCRCAYATSAGGPLSDLSTCDTQPSQLTRGGAGHVICACTRLGYVAILQFQLEQSTLLSLLDFSGAWSGSFLAWLHAHFAVYCAPLLLYAALALTAAGLATLVARAARPGGIAEIGTRTLLPSRASTPE